MQPVELDILFNDGINAINEELPINQYDVKKVLFFHIDMIAPHMVGDTECTLISSGSMQCITPYPYFDVMMYLRKWV